MDIQTIQEGVVIMEGKMLNPEEEIIKIGIWGPLGSGKTHFIVMQQFAERDGWNIRPLDEKSRELFTNGRKLLRKEHEFVASTPTVFDKLFLPFEFEGPGKYIYLKRRTFRVFLPECSGEFYEKPNEYPDLINEISRCHGIIWLIDPVQIDNPISGQKDYTDMIQEWLGLIHEKQGYGRLKHYMAFCLTKMDLPIYSKYLNNESEEFCLNKLGDDVRILLDDYCDPKKVNFFATSAIGFLPGTEIANLDTTDPQHPKLKVPANPVNLFEPFNWLFKVL